MMQKISINLVLVLLLSCNTLFNNCLAQTVKTPQEAITALKEGNKRFYTEKQTHPNQDMDKVKELENSQSPFAAVVACSDSRVPVELLFDCGFGDIFVIRTAGNTVKDTSTKGSVDYAVNHLHIKVLVLLSHSNCGAVTAVVNSGDSHHAGDDGAVTDLVNDIKEDISCYVGQTDKLNEAIDANLDAQYERVMNHPNIAKQIKEGKLAVVKAHYCLESGKVTFLN